MSKSKFDEARETLFDALAEKGIDPPSDLLEALTAADTLVKKHNALARLEDWVVVTFQVNDVTVPGQLPLDQYVKESTIQDRMNKKLCRQKHIEKLVEAISRYQFPPPSPPPPQPPPPTPEQEGDPNVDNNASDQNLPEPEKVLATPEAIAKYNNERQAAEELVNAAKVLTNQERTVFLASLPAEALAPESTLADCQVAQDELQAFRNQLDARLNELRQQGSKAGDGVKPPDAKDNLLPRGSNLYGSILRLQDKMLPFKQRKRPPELLQLSVEEAQEYYAKLEDDQRQQRQERQRQFEEKVKTEVDKRTADHNTEVARLNAVITSLKAELAGLASSDGKDAGAAAGSTATITALQDELRERERQRLLAVADKEVAEKILGVAQREQERLQRELGKSLETCEGLTRKCQNLEQAQVQPSATDIAVAIEATTKKLRDRNAELVAENINIANERDDDKEKLKAALTLLEAKKEDKKEEEAEKKEEAAKKPEKASATSPAPSAPSTVPGQFNLKRDWLKALLTLAGAVLVGFLLVALWQSHTGAANKPSSEATASTDTQTEPQPDYFSEIARERAELTTEFHKIMKENQ